eukprot:2699284-Amphidinium_carterae.1
MDDETLKLLLKAMQSEVQSRRLRVEIDLLPVEPSLVERVPPQVATSEQLAAPSGHRPQGEA